MNAQSHGVSRGWGRTFLLGAFFAVTALVAASATGCASPAQSWGGSEGEGPGVEAGNLLPGQDASTKGMGGPDSGPMGTSSDGGGTYLTDSGTWTGVYDSAPPKGPLPPWDGGFSASCSPINNGQSTVTINGQARTFQVTLPSDTSNMALLFEWHGFAQQAATFASQIVYDVPSGNWVPFDPNAFPMPLMIVAPDDQGLFVIDLPGSQGLDWDIVPENPPVDFPFFDGMLQCIEQQFNIDKTRVYSFGFSAGAVYTNLLSAKYPHLFAATISESGAWFNDMAEWADIVFNPGVLTWAWPAFVPSDKGNVLLTHGGPNDFATIISIEDANEHALPFLYNNGRTVVECMHDFGHSLDPDLTQGMYYEYLWAHQLGGPPLSGPIPDFPTGPNPVGETSCIFHPAP